MSKKK